MEIYIYSMILAGYAVLWLPSREAEGTGVSRIARVLGERGRGVGEEIREFSEVFSIAKRGGGNMTEILARTSLLIEERLDVENEISIMLGNRRLEQRIMDITPFMIIFYIGITSPGFFDVLYHNLEGAAFMTLCLGAYLSALVLSEKILVVNL